MRFWDTSALIPLMIEEPRSPEVWRLVREDALIVTSDVTSIEVASALWRRRHQGELSADAHDAAEHAFARLSRRWRSVVFSREVVDLALDLLSRHMLRSLDTIQLGSCITIARQGLELSFVTLDRKLALAARAEGFPVLP